MSKIGKLITIASDEEYEIEEDIENKFRCPQCGSMLRVIRMGMAKHKTSIDCYGRLHSGDLFNDIKFEGDYNAKIVCSEDSSHRHGFQYDYTNECVILGNSVQYAGDILADKLED